MKCPVCDNVNRSMVCLRCGFDASRDYEGFPTFGAVWKRSSASALREQWQEKLEASELPPMQPEPIPEPVKLPLRIPAWLVTTACAVTMALGIGIGLGDEKPGPTEPGESVQMQLPAETTVEPERWRSNILRHDENVNYGVFGSDYGRQQIEMVVFLDTLQDAPENAWDVSETDDGSVMAWVKPSGEQYDLYIGAEGGVRAGKSCKNMFEGYTNVTCFDFGDAFYTNGAEDMSGMFSGCLSLSELDLSSFDTANVQDMSTMFSVCRSLTELNLSSFDTANVQDMEMMFLHCESLTELSLSDKFVTTNADTSDMFFACPAGNDYQHLLN